MLDLNKLLVTTAALALTASFAATASAQDTDADENSPESYVAGEFDIAMLDSFTIYATSNEAEAFSLPTSVTVIDREQIEDYSTGTVSDLFRAVPGVQFQGGPRRMGDVPSIRGISGPGVQVFLDGARQSFGSGHDGRFFVDPELLQAVEVLRGPSSALYGSGSLGGVIGLRTVDAADFLSGDETYGFRVAGGYESVNEQWTETGTAFYRDASGAVDLVASVTGRQSNDIALGNGFDLASDDDILSSLLKGTWQITPEIGIEASWMRFQNDALEPNNPQDVTAADEVDKDAESNTYQATLFFDPATNWIDFEATVYGATHEVEEAETTTTRVVTREVESRGLRLSNRSAFDLGGNSTVRFTYGGEYYIDEQTGRDNTTVDGSRGGVPDAETAFYGLFAQAEFDFDRPIGAPGNLIVIPGVRYDAFESEAAGSPSSDEDATSLKFAASYLPTDWFMVFGSYSEAFRAPSFDERFADGTHFPLILNTMPPSVVYNYFVPNPDVRPEESETWEVGAGVDFGDVLVDGDSFELKGSYWSSDVTDLIDLEVNVNFACFVPPYTGCFDAGTSRYANVHDAELDGVEIEAQYNNQYGYASASFSSINGTDQATGDHLGVLFPDRFFIDAGIYVPNAPHARIGVRSEIAAEFDEVNTAGEERDSYAVFDIYAVWEPQGGMLDGFRLDLGVDNVGDEDYERVFAGTSEPGRNFKVRVGWTETF